MAVGTYALTTLAQLKAHLGITVSTYDTLLEQYIDHATAKIERWIGRQIKLRNYSEWYGGNDVRSVRVKQYPINNVVGVYTGLAAALTIASTTASDVRLTISINTDPLGTVANGALVPCAVLTRTTSGGTTTTDTLLFSTYPTTTSLVAAINAITGYSATVTTAMRCAQLHPRAGGDIKMATVVLTGVDVSSEFVFDSYLGIVTIRQDAFPTMASHNARYPSALQSTLIEYSAGYTTVPDDIHQACLVIAGTMYLSRKSDTSLQSESLGDYSYSMASADSSRAMMEDMLGSWKEIR
jgi:Phage gp6-like head-tail connector protein